MSDGKMNEVINLENRCFNILKAKARADKEAKRNTIETKTLKEKKRRLLESEEAGMGLRTDGSHPAEKPAYSTVYCKAIASLSGKTKSLAPGDLKFSTIFHDPYAFLIHKTIILFLIKQEKWQIL